MAQRRSVVASIDQFSHIGSRPAAALPAVVPDSPAVVPDPASDPDPPAEGGGGELSEVDDLLGRDESQTPKQPAQTRSRTRARGARQQTLRRADLMLPDAVMSDLRELGRPQRTGAQRTIGTKFFAAAYVVAVHELLGDSLDTAGLDRDDHHACVERIKDALRAALA